jgi:ribosomal protein S27E
MAKIILRVKCPKCGFEQNTRSIKQVKCMQCLHSYSLFPRKKRSRVIGIVKGSRNELFEEIRKQEAKKKLKEVHIGGVMW